MKLPSLHQVSSQTLAVVRRYPLESLSAVVGTMAAILLVNDHAPKQEDIITKVLLTAALALPGLLSITLWANFKALAQSRKLTGYAVIIIALSLFFFSLSSPLRETSFLKFVLLNATAHLLVSCIAFIKRGNTAAFWQFNKSLFLRIITAGIFSAVLYAGLAGAIAAMDTLFDLSVNGKWYARLFIFLAGIFNTFFFLAGVPTNAATLEAEQDYPKVLKFFTQFVLVPLVSIYLIILLAYEAKIIMIWQLPQGWVSNLIIAYGIAGILSILLVYPIRTMPGNSWIKIFSRWFYALLIPLLILMFVAIGKRISAYGFTEERVIVLATAIWLTGLALLYLFRPNGDIRIIPITLTCVALIVSLVAFSISETSQQNRLKVLLQNNHLLENGKTNALKAGQTISFKDRKNISSIVYYLLKSHGNNSLHPLFNTGTLSNKKYSDYENASTAIASLGFKFVDNYQTEDDSLQVNTWVEFANKEEALPASGQDFALALTNNYYQVEIKDSGLYVVAKDNVFAVYEGKDKISPDIKPREKFEQLIKKYGTVSRNPKNIPLSDLQETVMSDKYIITIYYNKLSSSFGKDEHVNVGYSGIILLKKR
ncbi:MAG: DUF4153 domain-containing protein [Niabella sp.]